MKIIDKINAAKKEQRLFFSFEYFPPKTPSGVRNLYARLDTMANLGPIWIDVTWGAGGSTADKTLEICLAAQNFTGLDTMMHLTCTNVNREKIETTLEEAKKGGIRNILALRGDPPRGEQINYELTEFKHAIDLVKFIKEKYGDYFGICVAGYPEGHPDGESYEKDLQYLKAKVEAGADFIITQLFYDVDLFIKFVKDCRAIGIDCPIIPGMMPIQTYAGFKRMTTLCKTFVPEEINKALEPLKNDDAAVKEYGVTLCVEMCQKLLACGQVPGLHFYTLNLEKSVSKILCQLKLSNDSRKFPWRVSAKSDRMRKEDVRPIFWSNRPSSYMSRTYAWDEFPNGRWGDSRSPAFGEPRDYHLTSSHGLKRSERMEMWGKKLESEQDVFNVFAKYCSGQITHLPWNDVPLSPETEELSSILVNMNSNGFLTINSQPRVNAADSSHLKYGWGGKGGYVYQKAYVEFFTSPENYQLLIEEIKKSSNISFVAANFKADKIETNLEGPCAVTWGVFPGKEILQPTVVDPESFMVWKKEAFALWETQWKAIYDKSNSNDIGQSVKVLEKIQNSYYLVSVVDNDFVNGNIWEFFEKMIELSKKINTGNSNSDSSDNTSSADVTIVADDSSTTSVSSTTVVG